MTILSFMAIILINSVTHINEEVKRGSIKNNDKEIHFLNELKENFELGVFN